MSTTDQQEQPQQQQEEESNNNAKRMKLVTPAVKVLGICGSLRKQSANMSALKYMAAQAARLHGDDMEFIIADISQVPFFNADTEDKKPPSVEKLLAQFKEADAFVFACPEYNYSMAPALKNALDWGSRLDGNVGFKGKAAAIISSGGGMRGSRAQYHLRQVGVFLDLQFVNKPEVMLSSFDGTFDNKETTTELVSERAQDLIVRQLAALKELSLTLKPKTEPANAEL